jgi:hypothetical protein
MKLTTPMQITAADSDSRTITGRIVAFNEPASASTGKVIFAKGSIQPTDVFLNLEHDRTRRIGKTLSMTMNRTKMTNQLMPHLKLQIPPQALMHWLKQWMDCVMGSVWN